MYYWVILLALISLSPATFSQTAAPPKASIFPDLKIVARGPHHRIWEYTTPGTEPKEPPIVHRYTELKDGMNRWSQAEGKWVEASDEIELFQGAAIARKARHQVIFSADLTDKKGTVDLLMPDSRRLRSRPLGLAYSESGTGKSVFVAEIKSQGGALLGANQVLYADAFDAVLADIQYTVKVGSFEQDVLLREQLPSPALFGLDPDKTFVQIWTEFLESPMPNIRKGSEGQELDFGPDAMFFSAAGLS